MTELGDAVLELAASSQLEFVMCAPFAKQPIVSRIISAVPDGVMVKLYTRWRPEEVASGVSDTGVLAVLQARGGVVYLHDRLHAKFYRNESRVILGSANLTGTALGWSPNPNIELLAAVSPEMVGQVEQQLATQSVQATPELAAEVDEIAEGLQMRVFVPLGQAEEPAETGGLWLPNLRIPGDLFLAYSRGLGSLTSRSSAAAAIDLEMLDLPQGLSKEQFYLLVGNRLRQQPLVVDIDDYLKQPRRFGEVRDRIEQLTAVGREDASDAWQTLMRWLLEFLPDRYNRQVPRHSELFERRTSEMERTS
jgi:hypothetical protein